MTLPAFAAERRRHAAGSAPAAIAQHSAANASAVAAAVDRWADTRTDGWTSDRSQAVPQRQ